MRFDFKKVMSESSAEVLVNIVTARRHDYQEEANQAAETELQSRNRSYETRENYRIAAEDLYAKDQRKYNEPLEKF